MFPEDFLNVEVEVEFKRRKYKGKQSTVKRRFRVVCAEIIESKKNFRSKFQIGSECFDFHRLAGKINMVRCIQWTNYIAQKVCLLDFRYRFGT